jgi:hypothetical protein
MWCSPPNRTPRGPKTRANSRPPVCLTYIRTPRITMPSCGSTPMAKPSPNPPCASFAPPNATAEPGLPRREDHHRLVAPPPRSSTTNARLQAGQLGSRRGARYRAYERLQDYLRHREDDLFLTDRSAPPSRRSTTIRSPPRPWTNSTASSAPASPTTNSPEARHPTPPRRPPRRRQSPRRTTANSLLPRPRRIILVPNETQKWQKGAARNPRGIRVGERTGHTRR